MPDPINVLIIGGGGREHALAWKLRQSARLGQLYTLNPENPGLAELAKPAGVTLDLKDTFALRRFCQLQNIGLVVIGPEDPLAAGLADALADPVIPGAPVPAVFGPTREAAQLEADKAWSKEFMRAAAIPTAEARIFRDFDSASAYLDTRDEPHVIKAAGLARGKGVFVPETRQEATAALERIFTKKEFGDAGKTVVIEERLKGREVSVFALVDGRNIYILESCQDHKRLGDGATGPNTGGMGALCPTPAIDERTLERVQREILLPTVDALRRESIEYRGVLYAGLMLTHGGPKVLEFNARFGDPECQVLMRRLKGDLLEILLATATKRLHEVELAWETGPAVCVVLAARGYPDKPQAGTPIHGLDQANARDGVVVFHAGTRLDKSGAVVTAGGRVLNVTAVGADLDQARARAYAGVEAIRFDGKTCRTDIGTAVVG